MQKISHDGRKIKYSSKSFVLIETGKIFQMVHYI